MMCSNGGAARKECKLSNECNPWNATRFLELETSWTAVVLLEERIHDVRVPKRPKSGNQL